VDEKDSPLNLLEEMKRRLGDADKLRQSVEEKLRTLKEVEAESQGVAPETQEPTANPQEAAAAPQASAPPPVGGERPEGSPSSAGPEPGSAVQDAQSTSEGVKD
jgi:hypothetical protein